MFRTLPRRVLLLALVAGITLIGLVGLGRLTRAHGTPSAQAAGKPAIDASYANGTVVYMIGPHMDTSPNPRLLAQAPELYILAYPVNLGPVVCTANCPPSPCPPATSPSAIPASIPACPPSSPSMTTCSPGHLALAPPGRRGSSRDPGRSLCCSTTPRWSTPPASCPSPATRRSRPPRPRRARGAPRPSCPSVARPIPWRPIPASCSSVPSSPPMPNRAEE